MQHWRGGVRGLLELLHLLRRERVEKLRGLLRAPRLDDDAEAVGLVLGDHDLVAAGDDPDAPLHGFEELVGQHVAHVGRHGPVDHHREVVLVDGARDLLDRHAGPKHDAVAVRGGDAPHLVDHRVVAGEHERELEALVDEPHRVDEIAQAPLPVGEAVVDEADALRVDGPGLLLDVLGNVAHDRGPGHPAIMLVVVGEALRHGRARGELRVAEPSGQPALPAPREQPEGRALAHALGEVLVHVEVDVRGGEPVEDVAVAAPRCQLTIVEDDEVVGTCAHRVGCVGGDALLDDAAKFGAVRHEAVQHELPPGARLPHGRRQQLEVGAHLGAGVRAEAEGVDHPAGVGEPVDLAAHARVVENLAGNSQQGDALGRHGR